MIYVLSTTLTQILFITLPRHNPIYNECSLTFYPGCWEHLKKKCTIMLLGAPTNTGCLIMSTNTPTVLTMLSLSCSLQWLFQKTFFLLRALTFLIPTEFQQMTSPSSSQRRDKLSFCHYCHLLWPFTCTQTHMSHTGHGRSLYLYSSHCLLLISSGTFLA